MRPVWILSGLLLLSPAAVAAPPRFASPFLSYTSAFDSRAVAVADLDHDGRPDVLVTNGTGLEVRLAAGDGTLGPAASSPAGTARFLAIGDLDADGHPDVVTSADSLHVGVLRGAGDGAFDAPVLFAVAKNPMAAVLGDLDGDGHLDLVCMCSRDNLLSVLRGDGLGGFMSRTDVPSGSFPVALALADLDHDSDLDVVVAIRQAQALTRMSNDGTGQFVSPVTTPLPGSPVGLALADLDGDGWTDAVTGDILSTACIVVPGVPGGGFGTPLTRALSDTPSAVAVADLDADGRADLVALDYHANRGEALLGAGGFAFQPPRFFGAARNPMAIAVADLNGGGKPDLVTACPYGPLSVHMGNGDGTFGGVNDLGMGPWPWSVAVGDLDADGHDDLVTSNVGDHTLVLRFGGAAGAFTAPAALASGTEPHGVTLADVNGDGHLDILVAQHGPGTQSYSTVAVYSGDGARGFAPRVEYEVGRWCEQVAVGDLNGDVWPDLAVACNDFGPTLSVLEGRPGGGFANRQDFALGSNANSVAIADVTGDGRPDVLLAAYSSHQVFVLPRHPAGGFATAFALSIPHPASVAAGDVTGDGRRDIVAAGGAGLSVFPALAGGGFGVREDHPEATGQLLLGDFDDDGRLDAATADNWPSDAVTVWFSQPLGGLGPGIGFGGGNRPFWVASGDVNGDHRTDLVCANMEGNSVSLLLNTGGMSWVRWLAVPPLATPAGLDLAARPNPLRGAAQLLYSLPGAAHVRIRVLDVAGRALASFDEGEQPAGAHSRRWDASGLPAGVCFLELRAGAERTTRRVVILD